MGEGQRYGMQEPGLKALESATGKDGGLKVDFISTAFDGRERLIQVAADVSDPQTWHREVAARSLARTSIQKE